MDRETYLRDPCLASALPFWKTEQVRIPENIRVIREDLFGGCPAGSDEPYFKLIHRLEAVEPPALPPGFAFVSCDLGEYAEHIRLCYADVGVSAEELREYTGRPVFDPALWVAVRDEATGRIAATGIAELDRSIGEGALEWIQVSPAYRRRGLGRCVVRELLSRLQGRAAFVTVSGRVNGPEDPRALYRSCGFTGPVIWHVVTVPPRTDPAREETDRNKKTGA